MFIRLLRHNKVLSEIKPMNKEQLLMAFRMQKLETSNKIMK